MNISNKNKWIYIAINKSGSSSMGSALCKYADENFVGRKGNNPLGHHSRIIDAKNYLRDKGIDFNEYFTFTLARNPWSREYSIFNYRRIKYQDAMTEGIFSKLPNRRQKILKKTADYPDFKSYFLGNPS